MVELARELQAHEYALFDLMKRPEEMGSWYVREIATEVFNHKGAFLVAETEGQLSGYTTLLAEVSSEEERDEQLHSYAYIGDLMVTESGAARALAKPCWRLAKNAPALPARPSFASACLPAISGRADYMLRQDSRTISSR